MSLRKILRLFYKKKKLKNKFKLFFKIFFLSVTNLRQKRIHFLINEFN